MVDMDGATGVLRLYCIHFILSYFYSIKIINLRLRYFSPDLIKLKVAIILPVPCTVYIFILGNPSFESLLVNGI